jgi:hypothetical protein
MGTVSVHEETNTKSKFLFLFLYLFLGNLVHGNNLKFETCQEMVSPWNNAENRNRLVLLKVEGMELSFEKITCMASKKLWFPCIALFFLEKLFLVLIGKFRKKSIRKP